VTEFALYVRLGFTHIADLAGYDHILFIAVLAVSYPPTAWRRLALLVTAFTLGHSLTLALATLDLVRVSAPLVETLIPVTILIAAIQAAWSQGAFRGAAESGETGDVSRFALAAGFGLIHGLGFSNFLRMLLGGEESLTVPLFAFNVGLEAGQLLILGLVLLLGLAAERAMQLSRRSWVLIVAGITAAAALQLLVQRLMQSN